jgi:bifunctional oligoribonuclease and PAP phosphatase NrnA
LISIDYPVKIVLVFTKCNKKVNIFKYTKIPDTAEHKLPEIIASRIIKARSVVIISHVNPDGDAVGSSLALYHYFRKTGKNVSVVMPNQYPDFLKWLPGSDDIIIFDKKKSAAVRVLEEADLMFFLDFNTPGRVGKAEEFITGSTAELVFRFIESAGYPELVDDVSSTCLYAGMMSDTGSFNYNSSQPETYRVLAELLKSGIDKDYIYSMIYDNFTESRLRLLGYCLDKKLVVLPEFKTAYMSLSLEEKKRYNYIRGDSEGFVNYPLSVKGVIFVAFFMENDDHVKISFRSNGSFDTNAFAGNFDGGGHINASGGESKLNLQDTINKFVSLLPEYTR